MKQQGRPKNSDKDNDILSYQDEESLQLKNFYSEEIRYFKEKFVDNQSCINSLLKSRGWNYSSNYLHCVCPKCKRSVNASKRVRPYRRKIKDTRLKEMIDVTRQFYRCSHSDCRHEFNSTSSTLFKKQSTRLWLWFLSIYTMGLLNGKIPKTFLMNEYYKFLIENNELVSSESSDDIKRAELFNISLQVKRATDKISILFDESKKKLKNKYLKYVGFEKKFKKNYIEWYTADRNDCVGWMMSWIPGSVDLNNIVASEISDKYQIDNVKDVQYLKKIEYGVKKKWILSFKILNGENVDENSIRWIFVDHINRIKFKKSIDLLNEYILKNSLNIDNDEDKILINKFKRKLKNREKFANYQIIQIHQNAKFLQRPFRITNDFREAFSAVIKKHGTDYFNKLHDNNILECPAEILHETAVSMAVEIGYNLEVKGSSC